MHYLLYFRYKQNKPKTIYHIQYNSHHTILIEYYCLIETMIFKKYSDIMVLNIQGYL